MIELIVVIAIITILLALLVTGVQKVRESANQTTCRNNLKQISLAALNYESAQKTLPPYATGRAREIYGSWVVHILPYLQNDIIYDKIVLVDNQRPSAGRGIARTGVRDYRFSYLYCTSDPSLTENTFGTGTTNYLANWNVLNGDPKRSNSIGRPLSTITDARSQVVLFAEAYSVCSDLYRVALDSTIFHNFGVTPYGIPSDDPSLKADYTMFQVQPRPKGGANACDGWRTQTPHSVMHIATVDGTVVAVNNSISPTIWKLALKPSDGQVIGDDWYK